MADKIQVRRGLLTNLPTLDVGEPAFTTDTEDMYVGGTSGNVLIGGGAFNAETLTYSDVANKVFGPLATTPDSVAEVNLFVISGGVQEYTKDYTVREVVGGGAPGYYVCVSTSSTAPGGGSFSGGSNPATGIDSVLVFGDAARVLY